MVHPGTVARLLLLAGAACGSLPPAAVPEPADDLAAALLAAPPHAWLACAEPLVHRGPAASPALVAALQTHPGAPGAAAAIAVLGRIGDTAAVALLQELVTDRGPLATDAALALGERRAKAAEAVLCACVDDRFADPTLRTAAAVALVRLGRADAAHSLLRGVLLAGTPAGQALQRELGLPEKPRWALERYLVQRMLQQEAGTDFGLETDASWPDLEEAATRITTWLESAAAARR
jgi:HEAT repeat protein